MKRAVCVLILSTFATPAFAQSSANVPAAVNFTAAMREALAEQAPTQQQWQVEYDAAKARRKSGLNKVIIGLVMEGGGAVLAMAGGTSCTATAGSIIANDCSTGAVTKIGVVAVVGGAIPFWWGVIQYFGANGDVHSLEATRPRAPSTAIALTDHQAIQLSLGHRSVVGYKVSW